MTNRPLGAALAFAAGLVLCGGAIAETVELDIGGHTALADLETAGGDLGDGPVALLVHGTFAHKDQETVEAVQAELSGLDIPSLAISLTFGQDRREGMLSCEGVHAHTHEAALDEIDAWIGWLREQGAGSIVLIGHSRGGAQVALYLSRQPSEAVRGAALLAPATDAPEDDANSYRERYGVALSEVLDRARAAGPDEVLDVPGFVYCPDASVTAAAFLSYHGPDVPRDTPRLLAQGVDVPVLVIAAGEDEVVTDLPARMPEVAEGSNIRFETVAGSDHRFLDFYAMDAADLIAGFVSSLPDAK